MPASQPKGRPRDPELDAAILRETLTILADEGLAAVTMEAVARKVGAGKSSLYRRWKSRDALLAEAIRYFAPAELNVDTGSLREDLLLVYEHYLGITNAPVRAGLSQLFDNYKPLLMRTRQAIPALMDERRGYLEVVVQRAVERGEIAAPPDLGLILDVVPGVAIYRYNQRSQLTDKATLERIVDCLVLPGLGLQKAPARKSRK